MFINDTDLLELISRNILKTSDIMYKNLYKWMYWYILHIGKQRNKRKNCKKRQENLNIFIEKFSVS